MQGGMQEYGNESLPMPGVVHILQPVGSKTTISSMVSAWLALRQHTGISKYLDQEKVRAGM